MNPLYKPVILLAFVFPAASAGLQAQCLVTDSATNTCTTDYINSFTLNSISASGNNGCSPNGYQQFIAPVWTLEQGQTYSWSASTLSGTGGQGFAIWLDYNRNGIYEASEMLASSNPNLSHSGSFTLPLTAVAGNNIPMRVRSARNTIITGADACTDNLGGFGETEDYRVDIICTPLNYINVSLGNDTVHCDGLQLDAENPGSTYLWSTGDTTQTMVADTNGSYWVQVTSAYGCIASDTVLVGIDPPSEAGVPMVTDYSVCVGQQGVLMITNGSVGLVSWTAINPANEENLIGNGTPYNYGAPSLQDTGTYAVFVIALSGVCPPDFSDTIYVTVVPPPVVTFMLPPALDTVVLIGPPVTLSGGSPAGGTYSGPGVTGNTFDPSQVGEGTFDILYSYTDTSECSSADTTSIVVLDDTGVEGEAAGMDMRIYPNPADAFIYLEYATPDEAISWSITDMTGRRWMQGNLYSAQGPLLLAVSTLPPGMYIATLRSAAWSHRIKWIKR